MIIARIQAMATDTHKLLSEIRALPEVEKLRLIDALLTDIVTPDPEVDRIWADEARRRWQAYKEGRIETVSYEDLTNSYERESPIPHNRTTGS